MKTTISILAIILFTSLSFAQTAPNVPANTPTGACLDKMLMTIIINEQHDVGSYNLKTAKIELNSNVETITVDYEFRSANGETKQLTYVGKALNDGHCRLQISKQ